MWRLRVATGDSPFLTSVSDFPGRQTWEFDPAAGTEEERQEVERLREEFTRNRQERKHSSDALMRLQLTGGKPRANQLPPVRVTEEPVSTATAVDEAAVEVTLRRAVRFYETIQAEDGHWAGDYGGPLFLMPGLLITLHVTGALDQVLTAEHKREMVRYLYNHQNPDGGWGLHIEGHSTMFGSTLNYVSLRILGEHPANPAMTAGREWILSHGSATASTSWGKFWLCVLGVYDYRGINPMPPEMWLLPYFLPVHPGRMWCHCRMVYLPMCYIYGLRAHGPTNTPLVAALREELYNEPYESINWNNMRRRCAKEDLYFPHPFIQDCLWDALYHVAEPLFNRLPPGKLIRRMALREAMKHIHYEDENTRYVCIGPVNKVINMLCCWVEDPNSEAFKKHLPRVPDYLWVAEDGMKMQGYNGSQLWDTAFAVQALHAASMMDETHRALKLAHSYLDRSQVQEDCPGKLSAWYRHISRGAWPFSTRDHGWPISDCSSEGLKASLILEALPPHLVGEAIPERRLCDCVDVILSYQNKDGGMATYENTRSYPWLEILNPSETFGNIIIDYSYVECTSASIQALTAFTRAHPEYRAHDIEHAIWKARGFLVDIQKDDGSWYGSWGVCFTYGTWFGISGLVAAGARYETSNAVRKAVRFLLEKQLPGGGWGESYLSSQDKKYVNLPGDRPHLVNTAWAMLALMEAEQHLRDPQPLHAAARVLVNGQMENGDFPQEDIIGVFNGNCMISYSAYRNIFPIWALGVYRSKVLKQAIMV
ncbi:unnamed protein product [Closterium sp. Yama58-4]|nr:unnamed protein product [Closterium sp. Yama58-4]